MELWYKIEKVLTVTEEELREPSHIIKHEIYFAGNTKKWTVSLTAARFVGVPLRLRRFKTLQMR